MKSFGKAILIMIVVFFLIWGVSNVKALVLTAVWGDELSADNIAGFDYMHAWDGTPKHRVLWYWGSSATVYYYSECGGEKIKLEKKNGAWTYSAHLASWSSTGSASDVIIWPYFKDWVI